MLSLKSEIKQSKILQSVASMINTGLRNSLPGANMIVVEADLLMLNLLNQREE
jgi:hypothetical protein